MSAHDLQGSGSLKPPPGRSSAVDDAIGIARDYLLSLQREDGHWCAELEGDSILESEYGLIRYFLGERRSERMLRLARQLRHLQLTEGGWANYPDGPPDVSSSVKAYFFLKLTGDRPEEPHMVRAKEVIVGLGGIDACNSFTKIYLAIFGQFPWSRCPAVPPELVLLPDWFLFNIYSMSSWSRAIVVPLSIIWATKPRCDVPPEAAIDELACGDASHRGDDTVRSIRETSWIVFFRSVDVLLKIVEASRFRPFRRKALEKAEEWIHARLESSDGLGAIFPPIINTILAFRCLGYAPDDLRIESQLRELEKLEIEEDGRLRVQPCFSAVWDTAISILSLAECGLTPDDPALLEAGRWLLDHEVKRRGDWTRSNPEGEPGGWYFEYANEFYPDVDDTVEVLAALSRIRYPDAGEDSLRQNAIERGLAWTLSMQNGDGGFPAFDRNCDNHVLTLIPFADHNAMIDPSCEDITGRALEAFHLLRLPEDLRAKREAVRFLRERQLEDGTWYGRWGCNYVYGSWLALHGLSLAGEDMSQERYRRSLAWLRDCQNADGGWGELPRSYDDPAMKGRGPSTASQTAWALMAFFSCGEFDSQAVNAGLEYLLQSQRFDGSWFDEHFTGTGFPQVFYLRYHYYATYFPLWALSVYRNSIDKYAGSALGPHSFVSEQEAIQ